MPDAKTMGRWGVALGPSVLKRIHEQMVRIARDKGITTGRRMRVDTTVVETNIHHPTDSTLLGDGVRVLNRIMKKITAIAGATGTRLRGRSRSSKLRVLENTRVARQKTDEQREAEAALSPLAGNNEPRGGAGKAVLKRRRRRRKAAFRHVAAARAGWP